MVYKGRHGLMAGTTGTHHPPPDSRIHIPFVASGTAPDDVEFIVGHLKNHLTGEILHRGITLPLPKPQRWAVYFRSEAGLALPMKTDLPEQHCTLEVLGLKIDGLNQVTVVWKDAVDLVFEPGFDIKVTWPVDGETDLCASSFTPYGTYDPSGTITVTLNTSDGRQIQPPWVFQDTLNKFWSAPFDPITPVPIGACTLDVELDEDGGGVSTQTVVSLGFQNC